jgi:hypothetical protein
MKILKSFKVFESGHLSEVPARFIPLESVGYYLDPDDGMTYAMLKNGGYEDEPWPADEVFGVDDEPWQHLSDEEKEIVNSLWRSCEEVVKPLIDWNLIDDIKDVSLANEIFDKGYIIKIEVKEQDVAENIYVEWVAHDKDDKHYYKFFKQMFGQIEKTNGDFSYNISVYRKGPSTWGAWDAGGYVPIHKEDESDVSEMIEQVKGMNPDKELRIFYSKW